MGLNESRAELHPLAFADLKSLPSRVCFSLNPDLQMMGVVDENGNKTGTFLVYGVPTPLKSLGQGAATTVVAAFSPSISENSGSYLSDCQISNESAQEFAKDEEIAQKLWKLSEEMVGQKLDL